MASVGSGIVLPLLLRKAVDASSVASEAKGDGQPSAAASRPQRQKSKHRLLTVEEMELRMQEIATVAFVDIQKQLYRGEEAYYEESQGHGNLMKGWESFVDLKMNTDLYGNSVAPMSSGGGTTSLLGGSIGGGTSRRVPNDARWFSSSSTSMLGRTVPKYESPSTELVIEAYERDPSPSKVESASKADSTEIQENETKEGATPMEVESAELSEDDKGADKSKKEESSASMTATATTAVAPSRSSKRKAPSDTSKDNSSSKDSSTSDDRQPKAKRPNTAAKGTEKTKKDKKDEKAEDSDDQEEKPTTTKAAEKNKKSSTKSSKAETAAATATTRRSSRTRRGSKTG